MVWLALHSCRRPTIFLLPAVLSSMSCTVHRSIYVPKPQYGTGTCLKIQNMRLADRKELGDCQEYAYVDNPKYKTLWSIRAKFAGLQQSSSQSVTWIPLSQELLNMLPHVGAQKWENEPQDFNRFDSAVVQAAANSAFATPENLEEPEHTVCVGA